MTAPLLHADPLLRERVLEDAQSHNAKRQAGFRDAAALAVRRRVTRRRRRAALDLSIVTVLREYAALTDGAPVRGYDAQEITDLVRANCGAHPSLLDVRERVGVLVRLGVLHAMPGGRVLPPRVTIHDPRHPFTFHPT